VFGCHLVETEDPSDRLKYLDRRMTVAALFEAQVVVRADAGEQCDLFAP
jgi:hypothetical protein